MRVDFERLLHHDMSDECPVCRAQDIVSIALIPAAASWEANNELPQFSIALHGAAELLGAMLQEGVPRDAIESAMGELLDDIELRIAEDKVGAPQGTA